MVKFFLAAGFCAALLAASCNNSTVVAADPVADQKADSILIAGLLSYGTIDSSLLYTTKNSYDSLLIYPVNKDTLAFQTSSAMTWLGAIPNDTSLDSVPGYASLGKVVISGYIDVRLSSQKISGSGSLVGSLSKVDTLTVSIRDTATPASPLFPKVPLIKDTSIVLSGDSAVYWLLLPGSSGKVYLSGNTKLLTNSQQTITNISSSMIASILKSFGL